MQVIASNYVTRLSVGPDLDHLRHDCSVVFFSHRNPDPAAYDDVEWIGATYTLDGGTVYAFVHDEYEGNKHPGQCPSRNYDRCWWNTVTSAVSTDGGRTYAHGTPPALVATYPYRYVPDRGTFGAMMPSNIVRNDRDGYYYALVHLSEQPWGLPNTNHLCLIRSKDLGDPTSWRAWSGGTTSSTTFIDPYRSNANPADHLCRAISPVELGDLALGSLTFVRDANQWLLVGVFDDGFYYSTSTDLINWTVRRSLLEATVPGGTSAVARTPSTTHPFSTRPAPRATSRRRRPGSPPTSTTRSSTRRTASRERTATSSACPSRSPSRRGSPPPWATSSRVRSRARTRQGARSPLPARARPLSEPGSRSRRTR